VVSSAPSSVESSPAEYLLRVLIRHTLCTFGRSPDQSKIKDRQDGRVEFDGMGRPFVGPSPVDCSPIYAGLRTNVPKNLMAFHGQPFLSTEPHSNFPPANDVSRYLLQTARGFQQHIRFNSRVIRVGHLRPPDSPEHPSTPGRKTRRWIVQVVPSSKSIHPSLNNPPQEAISISCDFVLAASGSAIIWTTPSWIDYTWPKMS
jgi:hypothetical protein